MTGLPNSEPIGGGWYFEWDRDDRGPLPPRFVHAPAPPAGHAAPVLAGRRAARRNLAAGLAPRGRRVYSGHMTTTTRPQGGAMSTTFDLDTHLAECRERMQAFVAQVLAPSAMLGDEFTNTDGMTMLLWKREFGHADVDDVLAKRAVPETATLTSDGHRAETHAWHEGPAADDEWVRVERYSARGMEFHGFVHAVSRRLLQTG